MANIKARLSRKAGWAYVDSLSTLFFRFGSQFLFAAFLSPAEFGVVITVALFFNFFESLSDFGIASALLRQPQEQFTEEIINTAFWLNFASCCAFFLLLNVVISPLVGNFYEIDQAGLILFIYSVTLVASPFAMASKIKIERQMRFKDSVIVNTVALVFATFTSVLLVINGAGLWAIVAQTVLLSLFRTVLLIWMEFWYPKFTFNKSDAKKLFAFGKYEITTKLADFFGNYYQTMLVASLFPLATVGVYGFANSIATRLGLDGLTVVKRILYPILIADQKSLNATNDHLITATHYVCLFTIPALAFVGTAGVDFLDLVFAEKWKAMHAPLQIICLSSTFIIMTGCILGAVKAGGHIRFIFGIHLIKFGFIQAPIISFGALFYGFYGLLWSTALAKAILSMIELGMAYRKLKTPIMMLVFCTWRGWFGAILIITVSTLLKEILDSHTPIVLSAIHALAASTFIIFNYRKLLEFWKFIREEH